MTCAIAPAFGEKFLDEEQFTYLSTVCGLSRASLGAQNSDRVLIDAVQNTIPKRENGQCGTFEKHFPVVIRLTAFKKAALQTHVIC